MCTILLPIKPEYASRILNGTKKYEYRTRICKKEVDRIIIYCTAPIKKVIGEVEVIDTIATTPLLLWKLTGDYAGLSKQKFDDYYLNRDIAYAYTLGEVKKYTKPITLESMKIFFYPQTFIYIN